MKFQILRVLPERHPSRPYTAELERRFIDAEGVFVQSHPAEVSWSSHIWTTAELNSSSKEAIQPVSEFSSDGQGTGYFIGAERHIDPIYQNWE